MEREFTEEKYIELKQYLPEKNDEFCDLIRNLSISNTSLLENPNINDCLNDTETYYNTIFDHYHTTAAELKTIFSNSRDLDDAYSTLMQNYLERINLFRQYIDKMADVMSKKPADLSPSTVFYQFIDLNKKHQQYDESETDGGSKKSGYDNCFDYNWTGDYVTSEFLNEVLIICDKLKMDPDDLMGIMSFESGFNPEVKNKYSGAIGLIQFMPGTAKNLGTSTAELSKMSAIEQLDYVYKYLKPYTGKLNSIEDAYMAVFMPIAIGKDNDYILGIEGSSECISGKLTYGKVYEQNKGLDYNHDGIITKEEAVKKVKDKMKKYK